MQDYCFARKVLGEEFLYERHVNYLLKSLKRSTFGGTPLEVAEAHRLSSLFFVVSGLDLLGALDTRLNDSDKQEIIQWIYSYQVDKDRILLPLDSFTSNGNDTSNHSYTSSNNNSNHHQQQQQHHLHHHHHHQPNDNVDQNNTNHHDDNSSRIIRTSKVSHAGFRASSMIDNDIPFDCGILTMTYCALATLVILGDDLKRVDRKSIIRGMRELQLPNGSFKPSALGGESDMRLVYCAAAVSRLLNDWSGIDRDRCAKFIKGSLSYEGAFAQYPGSEAHGGSTFCALASLKLMNKLEDTLSYDDIDRLIRWCINRLDQGFTGRPNKDQDTCYSFWIGACLVILDHFEYVGQKNLLDFILMAQEERGGLSKVPDFYSDPLHTYLGFAGLTFIDDDLCSKRGVNLLKLDPTLNISQRARSYLDKIHQSFE
uniref:Geranylgeranyl transferase type-1 subunit beta n=1 Tax=Aceria tosichella TaxID=561515 RepID=A0A6G1SN50_9ACAR